MSKNLKKSQKFDVEQWGVTELDEKEMTNVQGGNGALILGAGILFVASVSLGFNIGSRIWSK